MDGGDDLEQIMPRHWSLSRLNKKSSVLDVSDRKRGAANCFQLSKSPKGR